MQDFRTSARSAVAESALNINHREDRFRAGACWRSIRGRASWCDAVWSVLRMADVLPTVPKKSGQPLLYYVKGSGCSEEEEWQPPSRAMRFRFFVKN